MTRSTMHLWHCDKVAVWLQGRVVESGTHSALLSQGGKYAKMWARQANVDDTASLGSE